MNSITHSAIPILITCRTARSAAERPWDSAKNAIEEKTAKDPKIIRMTQKQKRSDPRLFGGPQAPVWWFQSWSRLFYLVLCIAMVLSVLEIDNGLFKLMAPVFVAVEHIKRGACWTQQDNFPAFGSLPGFLHSILHRNGLLDMGDHTF